MSIELIIHEVEWCRHGHPVLILREQYGQRKLAIAVTAEDAQDLFAECSRATGRFRACALLVAALEAAGGELLDVTLAPGDDAVLRGILTLGTTFGRRTIPSQATDGLVLAIQRQLPILIPEGDFARVCYSGMARADKRDPARREERREGTRHDPLAPFRAVVEGLDFEQPHRDEHHLPPE